MRCWVCLRESKSRESSKVLKWREISSDASFIGSLSFSFCFCSSIAKAPFLLVMFGKKDAAAPKEGTRRENHPVGFFVGLGFSSPPRPISSDGPGLFGEMPHIHVLGWFFHPKKKKKEKKPARKIVIIYHHKIFICLLFFFFFRILSLSLITVIKSGSFVLGTNT